MRFEIVRHISGFKVSPASAFLAFFASASPFSALIRHAVAMTPARSSLKSLSFVASFTWRDDKENRHVSRRKYSSMRSFTGVNPVATRNLVTKGSKADTKIYESAHRLPEGIAASTNFLVGFNV